MRDGHSARHFSQQGSAHSEQFLRHRKTLKVALDHAFGECGVFAVVNAHCSASAVKISSASLMWSRRL